MTRLAVTMFVILLAAALAPPSLAGPPGPVCRAPSVVREMTRQIRAVHYYSRVDPGLVSEQPTTDPQVVRCNVCVEFAPYNMQRFGDRSVKRCLAHGFNVQIFPTGFVVHDLG